MPFCRWIAIFAVGIMSAIADCAPASASSKDRDWNQILETRVKALQADHPGTPGFALYVRSDDGRSYGAATGVASPRGAEMTAQTPVRIASITKTYVAATALHMMESGVLDLDAPIAELINPVYNDLLKADGYDTQVITVRHLLMHVSGMADHSGDAYIAMVLENPGRVWTREDQIKVLVAETDPLGPPESTFKYSDTGYVILGDILERLSGKPLHQLVRERMKFDTLGLKATWWDEMETAPAQTVPRAHQYIDGQDIHDWNGTIDAFGGGGLIASMADVAEFYAALFHNRIFAKSETLKVMTTAPGNPFPDRYRIGLFPRTISGLKAYGHGGFWGTYVFYTPDLGISIAGVSLNQAGYRPMRGVLDGIIHDIAAAKN